MKRIVCGILAAVLLFLTCACGKTNEGTVPEVENTPQPTYTKTPGTLSKKETVFATLSADGTVQNVQVTDRLITDVGQVRVEDISFLQEIENVKGSETAQIDGVNVTWHMQSNQLYYTGTTTKSLPVNVHIEYFLDGKSVRAKELRGKSGEVRIAVRADNVQKHGNLYTPFLVVGGAVLENAKTVQVTNGATLGDGNRDVAFGVMLPGMNYSLGLAQMLLPEQFTVQFQTDACMLSDLYFAVVPLSTAKLSDALSSMLGALELSNLDFSELLLDLKNFGQDENVRSFLQTAPQSLELFQTAARTMRQFDDVQPLLRVLQKYLTEENAKLLQETLDSLTSTSLQDYAQLLQNPTFIALLTDMGAVSAAFTDLIPLVTAMLTELQSEEVRASVQALPQMLESLRTLTAAIEQDEQWLDTLTALTDNGAISQFSALLQSVQGIVESGAFETLSRLSETADDLQGRLDAVLDLGKKYSIFTVAPEDAVTSVYFIMRAAL